MLQQATICMVASGVDRANQPCGANGTAHGAGQAAPLSGWHARQARAPARKQVSPRYSTPETRRSAPSYLSYLRAGHQA